MNSHFAVAASAIRKSFPQNSSSLMRVWLGLDLNVPSFEVLKGVSVSVSRGELLGVLGRNGAGKSTLLRVLAGIYWPDDGSVDIDGDLAGLFELGGLGNGYLTGRAFVSRYLQLFGTSTKLIKKLSEEIHEFSELETYFDEKILTYSAGMAARLYFATATAIQHDVYLVDEILSVGDEHFQVKSWARIRERLSSGASGLLVTHDWSSVIRLCRNACVLDAGSITIEGPADKVIAKYLELPIPSSQDFILVTSEKFYGDQGEPLHLDFEVVSAVAVAAEVAISIESLQLGVGWEPVILTDFTAIPGRPGIHRIRIDAPYTPLRAGTYELGIFVVSGAGSSQAARETLCVRSWTYGNGLQLVIRGKAQSDLTPFPVTWHDLTA